MLSDIKELLLKDTNNIIALLEAFGFAHIKPSTKEIRFARDEQGGKNISIRLENNENLFVNDYSRGINKDIISYIIQEKNETFRNVIQETKKILNLDNNWRPRQKCSLFGGIYENILRQNKEIKLKTYDENILEQYEQCGNLRFLRDHISLESQKFWGIRFSIEENMIIIPIRNEYSELVGIKGRINWEPSEDESKYYYPVPVAASQLLYGYSDNYQYLYGNDVIIVESEKSVMQAWDFGVRNIVALGSNNLSDKQAKLLLQLQPKRIILAMDEGLEFELIQRNANTIKKISSIFMPEVWYWNASENLDINNKDSPTDNGQEIFEEIMKDQLVRIY